MKRTLPDNAFGRSLMLTLLLLIIVVPAITVFWAVSLVAPWWVAFPTSLLASLFTVIATVKFK